MDLLFYFQQLDAAFVLLDQAQRPALLRQSEAPSPLLHLTPMTAPQIRPYGHLLRRDGIVGMRRRRPQIVRVAFHGVDAPALGEEALAVVQAQEAHVGERRRRRGAI